MNFSSKSQRFTRNIGVFFGQYVSGKGVLFNMKNADTFYLNPMSEGAGATKYHMPPFKVNGGKKAGLQPATGNKGKRQVDRLLVLGGCTHRSETSGISTGHQAVCSPTQNQEPLHLAFTCTYLDGSLPALFPPLFRAPSLFSIPVLHVFVFQGT